MSDFFKKLASALKTAGVVTWNFLKTPFGAAVTLLSILTVTSTVMLSVRLYDFVHVDDKEIGLHSGLEASLDLFAVQYENESGEITVEGTDGQQVVAPGTSVEYTLRLRNKDTTALDYQLSSGMKFLSEYELPLKVRLIDPDEQYILGSPTSWVPITELNHVTRTDTLIAGETAEYVFQWKWDYEGDDLYDTFLGNAASEKPIEVEVSMSVYAAANTDIGLNGGFMKSGLGEIVFTAVVITCLGGSLALLITPPFRKKYLAKKAGKTSETE